jgi:hypothetical protein
MEVVAEEVMPTCHVILVEPLVKVAILLSPFEKDIFACVVGYDHAAVRVAEVAPEERLEVAVSV